MRASDAEPTEACRVFLGDTRLPDGRVGRVLAASRGVAYGDGLFETMRADRGAIHWWDAHWARLTRGAKRLCIPLPSRGLIESECEQLLRDAPDAAIKLMLIRGQEPSHRGYTPSPNAAPLWWFSAHALPSVPPADGLRLRWCETRLSSQPCLAGLKHCNRLEQVMARAEWQALEGQEAGCDDGLMLDDAGDVIAATSANLFIYRDAVAHDGPMSGWYTPRLERCGIGGICREWALAALGAREAVLSPEDVLSAEAVFLCNALRGILPVAQLGPQRWAQHPALAEARRRLAAAHPGFADHASAAFFEVRP
jgi:4-amino-4-deoxychorismate lyase